MAKSRAYLKGAEFADKILCIEGYNSLLEKCNEYESSKYSHMAFERGFVDQVSKIIDEFLNNSENFD